MATALASVRAEGLEPSPEDLELLVAVAAGKLPDMAQMGSTMLGEFIKLGVLDPVDAKTFHKGDFFPAAWDGGVKDGKAYGVPWYVDTRSLYYRTDLAKKAGLDKPPATWEDPYIAGHTVVVIRRGCFDADCDSRKTRLEPTSH